MTSTTARGTGARVAARRPPWRTLPGAVVLLLAGYVTIIAAGDARSASGSDAGGKLATVVVMAEEGSLVPDVGYWAEAQDPDGAFHPLYNTTAVGDRWVQATSLPFVVAAVPLYRLGGPAGVLVLPVLGGLVAALAARRLSRRLHGDEGWAAFWLVGAAGPVAFYTGDFWEHAPAVGLALLAIALALDDDDRSISALGAGLAAGLAVVLRAEMLLYGLVFVMATLVVKAERRRVLGDRRRVALTLVGAAAPVVANGVVERLLLSHGVRDDRAAESVTSAAADVATRLTDAVVTSVGLLADDDPAALLLGALLVGALLVVGAHLASPDRVPRGVAHKAAVAVVGLYALWVVTGPGFAPGFVTVAPLAAVGVFAARTPPQRVIAATALAVIPLVWLTAWSGNHVAQWGGRYLLLSGVLLTVLAIGPLERAGWRDPLVAVLVGSAIVVAAGGMCWHVERTRTMAGAVAAIEQLPDDVVVITDVGHLGREGGAWYGQHRWLRTEVPGEIAPVVAVARAAGAERLAVVQAGVAGATEPEAPDLAGYRPSGVRQTVPLFDDLQLVVQRYDAR